MANAVGSVSSLECVDAPAVLPTAGASLHPRLETEPENAGALRKQKAGKCYHPTYHDWQANFMW